MAVQTMSNCVKVKDSEGGNARSSRERKEAGKCCNFPVLHAVSGWREKLAHPNLGQPLNTPPLSWLCNNTALLIYMKR